MRKPNNKFRGKRQGKFRKDDKFSESAETKVKQGPKNDVSWYVTDDQILKDVARIPYSIPVGTPFTRRGVAETDLQRAQFDDAIPGVAAMGIVPTIGNAQTANDAVNVAANGMYTFVRHLNSGSRNYDANDLIIYCMAVNSVYYTISWATRLYATLTLYAQGNRYLPDALLRAQNVDPNDLRSNMSLFRSGLNQAIRKISTLVVPGVLPIFARHSWLFSNYFIEGESIKDQIYLFYPTAWYQFTYDSDNAGMLKCHLMKGTRTLGSTPGILGFQDILDIINEMITPIFADEDFNIISGDILKAYGESNVLKLGLVPDELPISVGFNEEVLLQFKNAKPCEVMWTQSGSTVKDWNYDNNFFDVYQSSGKSYLYVERDPANIEFIRDFGGGNTSSKSTDTPFNRLILQACMNEWSKYTLLTSPHATVEPAENMVSTRLTLAFNIEYDDLKTDMSNTIVNDMYFGSEWPIAVAYWCYHRDRSLGQLELFRRDFNRSITIKVNNSTSIRNAVTSYLPIRSAFKYAPEVSIIDVDTGNSEVTEAGRTVFEVDNYTLVSPEVISMLHNAAIQGEYNIPRVALFPTR